MWHSCCPFVVRGETLQTNRQGPNFQLRESERTRRRLPRLPTYMQAIGDRLPAPPAPGQNAPAGIIAGKNCAVGLSTPVGKRLDGRSARSRVLYDNPGDTLLRRRYIYRPWSTLQVPGYAAVLCYAVGSCRPWSTLQVPGFVPTSGLLHAVGTGLEYPAGIRFAAKTRRDSFTPSVPALEYPAEVPGYARNPGGTMLRRRYRP